jgi:hypothetical protein
MSSGTGSVTANFTRSPLVKNQTSGVAYNLLQTACDEASSNDTISARSTLPAAGLSLGKTTSLTIEGGYDADYVSVIGLTPVQGPVRIKFAPIQVKGIVIRP